MLWVDVICRQINKLLSCAEGKKKRDGNQLNEQNHCHGRKQTSLTVNPWNILVECKQTEMVFHNSLLPAVH